MRRSADGIGPGGGCLGRLWFDQLLFPVRVRQFQGGIWTVRLQQKLGRVGVTQ